MESQIPVEGSGGCSASGELWGNLEVFVYGKEGRLGSSGWQLLENLCPFGYGSQHGRELGKASPEHGISWSHLALWVHESSCIAVKLNSEHPRHKPKLSKFVFLLATQVCLRAVSSFSKNAAIQRTVQVCWENTPSPCCCKLLWALFCEKQRAELVIFLQRWQAAVCCTSQLYGHLEKAAAAWSEGVPCAGWDVLSCFCNFLPRDCELCPVSWYECVRD